MKLPVDINDIKDFAYITSRKLLNEQDEKSGEVVMWRRKGEEVFNYNLTLRVLQATIFFFSNELRSMEH